MLCRVTDALRDVTRSMTGTRKTISGSVRRKWMDRKSCDCNHRKPPTIVDRINIGKQSSRVRAPVNSLLWEWRRNGIKKRWEIRTYWRVVVGLLYLVCLEETRIVAPIWNFYAVFIVKTHYALDGHLSNCTGRTPSIYPSAYFVHNIEPNPVKVPLCLQVQCTSKYTSV